MKILNSNTCNYQNELNVFLEGGTNPPLPGRTLAMKIITIIAACFLLGCATQPSIEDLEKQAMASGDWTEVERREVAVSKRNVTQAKSCPTGMVNYCYDHFSEERCECVARRR